MVRCFKGRVLSFAAVALHGREWWTRIAWRAVMLLALVPTAAAQPATPPPPAISLSVRSMFTRRSEILDVTPAGDRLLVLGPDGVAAYARGDGSGDAGLPLEFATIDHTRPWPRDTRGRIQMSATGFSVWMPGVTCRGQVGPMRLSCDDEPGPWPVGLDNYGVPASRNLFTTPEGVPFYSAAPLTPSTQTPWAIVDGSGTLAFLDSSRAVVRRAGAADDIARIDEPCATDTYVLTTSRSAHAPGSDDLRLERVRDGGVDSVDMRSMQGVITALWAAAGSRTATVVVRHQGPTRYEALQIALACAR